MHGLTYCCIIVHYLADDCGSTSLQTPSGMIQTPHSGDPEASDPVHPPTGYYTLWISSILIHVSHKSCSSIKRIFTFFKQTNVKCSTIYITITSFCILSCKPGITPLAFDRSSYPSKHYILISMFLSTSNACIAHVSFCFSVYMV